MLDIVATKTLSPVERAVLTITTDASTNDVLDVYTRFGAFKSELKRLDELMEAAIIEWIKANGDLVMTYPDGNAKRFYVGATKTTKCINPSGTLDALLESAGGDLQRVIDCLSSGCFRYAAVKKVIGEEKWGGLFKVESSDSLEEGSAKKLKVFDSRFVK